MYFKDVFIGFMYYCECFWNQVFYVFVFFNMGMKFVGFCFQFVIGEFFYFWFYCINKVDGFMYMMQCMIVMVIEYFG